MYYIGIIKCDFWFINIFYVFLRLLNKDCTKLIDTLKWLETLPPVLSYICLIFASLTVVLLCPPFLLPSFAVLHRPTCCHFYAECSGAPCYLKCSSSSYHESCILHLFDPGGCPLSPGSRPSSQPSCTVQPSPLTFLPSSLM